MPCSVMPTYHIYSGTGTLHPVHPWTPTLSQSSHWQIQSSLWWSSGPTRRRCPPACRQGPGSVVVVVLSPQPPDWRRCGWTGPAGGEREGSSGSSCSSVRTEWDFRDLRGNTNTLTVAILKLCVCVCVTWTLSHHTVMASYVEEQSSASISSF